MFYWLLAELEGLEPVRTDTTIMVEVVGLAVWLVQQVVILDLLFQALNYRLL
jgi:hypothetical protein